MGPEIVFFFFQNTTQKPTSACLKASWQAQSNNNQPPRIKNKPKKTPLSSTISIWSHTMLSLADFFVSLVESRECWEEVDSLASGMSRRTF